MFAIIIQAVVRSLEINFQVLQKFPTQAPLLYSYYSTRVLLIEYRTQPRN